MLKDIAAASVKDDALKAVLSKSGYNVTMATPTPTPEPSATP
jgi:hypothetical protein